MNRCLASVLFLAVAMAAGDVLACGCSKSPDPNDAEAVAAEVRSADFAAAAEVVDFKDPPACDLADDERVDCAFGPLAVFSITKSVKGPNVGPITVDVMEGTSCNPGLSLGDRVFIQAYVVHAAIAHDSKSREARLVSSACSIVKQETPTVPPGFEAYRKEKNRLASAAASAPKDIGRWRELAQYLESWRDNPDALAAYGHMTEIQPDSAEAFAGKGRMLFLMQNGEAGFALDQAVALAPGDTRSRSLALLMLARAGTVVDTRNLDLRGLDLKDARFSNLDLTGADFRGAKLAGASFEQVNLDGAKFGDADLDSLWLRNVSLRGADWGGNSFDPGIVGKNDVTNLRLAGTVIDAVRVPTSDAYLAKFLSMDLSGARLKCARFVDLPWTRPMPSRMSDRWASYWNELRLAKRIAAEVPAMVLDPACTEGIERYLHPNCVPWMTKADRSPACKIED